MNDPADLGWVPAGVDISKASAARMYDYLLGGANNFAVDRRKAEEVLAVLPQARTFALLNRACLRRCVTYLVDRGVRQFVDLGSGLPTAGNVHAVAQGIDPTCRVVYVDNEPIAVAHSNLILDGNAYATCIEADITRPQAVLDHAETRRLIDFTEPVGVLMFAVVHFVPDTDDPGGIVAAFREPLAHGSFLGLTHATADDYPDRMQRAVGVYQRTQNPAYVRSRGEITRIVERFSRAWVQPGMVYANQWHPDDPQDAENPTESLSFAVVAKVTPRSHLT